MARFNVTTLLGYSLKKEYVGTMNYRNVITLTVETLHRTDKTPRYDLEVYDKKSFTVATGTSLASSNNGLSTNQEIYFTSTGTLPNPLSTGVIYFVTSISTNSFSVSSTLGGSDITFTNSGSGVHSFNTVTPIKVLNDYEAPEVNQNSNIPIVLNSTPFGTGRVINISEPRSSDFSENGLTFWKRNITLELYEAGDSSNIPASVQNTLYARLKDNLFNSRISEITEDFSFTDDEQGNLGYVQNITVSCVDEVASGSPSDNTKTGIYLAREIAQNLIESEVDFGYIGNLTNLYGKSGKKTYSTDVDVINGTVTITKTFKSLLVRTPATYNFQVNQDGSINISENISLRNKDLAISSNNLGGIISILDNIKSTSYSRCSSYFDVYKTFITTNSSVDSLGAESKSLITVQRAFNESTQEYSQTVIYSNARNLRTYYVLEINQNISVDQSGYVNISETGDFVNKKSVIKSSDDTFLGSNYFASGVTVKTSLDSEQQNSLERAKNLYVSFFKLGSQPSSLKLIRSSRRASLRGKTFGYSVTFSNDPSFIKSDGITQVKSKIDAVLPKQIAKSYILPSGKNVFTQYRDQSTSGEMTISQNATLKRNDSNKTPDLVDRPLTTIRKLYNNCLLSLYNKMNVFGGASPDNFVIKKVSFSYNSSREVSVTVAVDYLIAANRAGPKSNLYLN